MRNSILIFMFVFSVFCITGCKSSEKKAEKIYLSAVEDYSVHNFSEASRLCEMALKAKPSFFQAEFLKGKISFFENDYKTALKIFANLEKHHSEFTEARIWKIRCLILMENYSEAQKFLDREIAFNSTDWRVFYLYSLLYRKQKLVDKELVMLNNAETALKDSAKVYSCLAYDWQVLGFDEKENLYKEKIKILGK